MNILKTAKKVEDAFKKLVSRYAEAKRVSEGRARSHLLRAFHAKINRRGKPVISIKTTGEQHRLWRAAGRVGVPTDY